jgi:hypothetical protein
LPFRDFSQTNIDRFVETLHAVNWSEVTDCDNAQTAYNRFSDLFNNFFELHFPLQYVKPNRNFSKLEPWFTRGLLISRKNKLRLSNLAAHDPSPLNIAAFKQFRNVYNRVVKLPKKTYFEKELKANQSNLKKTWELIRTAAILPKMNKEGISQILIEGNLISEPLAIATKFNKFFVSMPSLIVYEIIAPSHDPDPEPDIVEQLLNRPLFSFSNNPVTQSEIIDAFKLLNPNPS